MKWSWSGLMSVTSGHYYIKETSWLDVTGVRPFRYYYFFAAVYLAR